MRFDFTLVFLLSCAVLLGGVLYFGCDWEKPARDEYSQLLSMRQSAAIEYMAHKEHYQSLPEDDSEKTAARLDTLEAFNMWVLAAARVKEHPNYQFEVNP